MINSREVIYDTTKSGSSNTFHDVQTDGTDYYSYASSAYGVSPAFRIGIE